MNNPIQQVIKISKSFFLFALLVSVLSSCSQRITGNYKTNRMETEQANAFSLPENHEINTAENKVQAQENENLAIAENNVIDEKAAQKDEPVITKKSARKILKEKITKMGDKRVAQLKDAAFNSLPLLAMNKSTKNIKAEKKPFRDYLVLGIVLLIVGVVALAILPRPLDLIGSVLALVGIIFIVLYIVQVAL